MMTRIREMVVVNGVKMAEADVVLYKAFDEEVCMGYGRPQEMPKHFVRFELYIDGMCCSKTPIEKEAFDLFRDFVGFTDKQWKNFLNPEPKEA